MKHLRIYILTALAIIISPLTGYSQEDLLSQVPAEKESADYVQATFKGTRVINFQTLEVVGKKTLDFRISHRFGEFNSASYNAYGLDGPANIRLGLEYSPNGRLMFGFGRSSYQKLLDGFAKFRLLRQTEDDGMPLSLTLFTSVYSTMLKDPNKSATGFDKYSHFSDRLSFVNQIIIGRKFSSAFSLQLSPTMVHYNLVDNFLDVNDTYQLGISGRLKITKRFAITAEYAYNFRDPSKTTKYYNPLGIGFDIETGGHVFQMFVTNAFGIADNQIYPYNKTSWTNNGIRFGFNVSRVFSL